MVAHKHRYVSCMDLEFPPIPKIEYDWWAILPEGANDYYDFKDKIRDRMGHQ